MVFFGFIIGSDVFFNYLRFSIILIFVGVISIYNFLIGILGILGGCGFIGWVWGFICRLEICFVRLLSRVFVDVLRFFGGRKRINIFRDSVFECE